MSIHLYRREAIWLLSLGQDVILGLLPAAELAAPLVTQLLSSLQERMVDQHLRRPATLNILVETFVDKVLEVFRPLRRDSGWLVLDDVEENTSVML